MFLKSQSQLNGETVDRGEMVGQIENLLRLNKTKTLELQGDKDISFKLFGEIIKDVRKAGIENFIFATQKIKTNQNK